MFLITTTTGLDRGVPCTLECIYVDTDVFTNISQFRKYKLRGKLFNWGLQKLFSDKTALFSLFFLSFCSITLHNVTEDGIPNVYYKTEENLFGLVCVETFAGRLESIVSCFSWLIWFKITAHIEAVDSTKKLYMFHLDLLAFFIWRDWIILRPIALLWTLSSLSMSFLK